MARTMTADRFAHVRASILAGDETNGFNADARLILAEYDAATKASAEARAITMSDMEEHELREQATTVGGLSRECALALLAELDAQRAARKGDD